MLCEGMHGRAHAAQKECRRLRLCRHGCCMQVGYGVVPAGQNFQVQTFKTHPWIARSGVNGEGHRLMVEGHMVRAVDERFNAVCPTKSSCTSQQTQVHRSTCFCCMCAAAGSVS